MAIIAEPRSISEATRFTATTPHANSKPVEPRSRFAPSSRGPVASRGNENGSGGNGRRSRDPGPPGGGAETPEQRVARLRAAHQRARDAGVSRFDKIVDGGRRFFDSAHKVTVLALIGATAIAGLLTVYTAADMIMYNRKRKGEFIEAQKKMEADSLQAARLAYMTGKATEDQITLVEEANEKELRGSIFKMPDLLSTPKAIDRSSDTAEKPQSVTEAATWPKSETAAPDSATLTTTGGQVAGEKNTKASWSGWLFSSSKKQEGSDDASSAQQRLGWESLSEEDDGSGVRNSDLARAVEDKQAYLRQKAQQAFEKEKENQRTGGPLDQVGLPKEPVDSSTGDASSKKKGWLW